MSFLKNIFKKKEESVIASTADFWKWFVQHEQVFYTAVKGGRERIEKDFFEKLTPKLEQLKEDLFFVTGLYNATTAELIVTADGRAKNIVFAEELIQAAPALPNWRFTALKPALAIADVSISMNGYDFNADNIFFYANELPAYPDEIDITIVHNDLTDENKNEISGGVYLFLDNYLGELAFLENIDHLDFKTKQAAEEVLIPVNKLKDFLVWRKKEFVEKYAGIRHQTQDDNYSVMEGQLQNGSKLLAVINTDLLQWDSKASHPWMTILIIKYNGSNNNGFPDSADYEELNNIEDNLMQHLLDAEGYLNIGRQTAENAREIYFACKDFRKPAKLFYEVKQQYKDRFEIDIEIFKDKYWQCVERFNGG
jgi:hypothetical protein